MAEMEELSDKDHTAVLRKMLQGAIRNISETNETIEYLSKVIESLRK